AVDVSGQVFVTEHCGQSLLDGVERLDRAAVVILPVRFDELLGNTIQLRRVERQWLRLMLAAKGGRRRRLGLGLGHSGQRDTSSGGDEGSHHFTSCKFLHASLSEMFVV